MESKFKRALSRLVFGKPIATRDAHHHTIGPVVGLAVLASDNLSSVAYATEEILIVLAAVGAASFHFSLPIAIGIVSLLVILTISYRQTLYAYPNGGGAYIVAKENLGETAAQTAGAALLMDYVLTVAVSISSGADQIVSVFPNLHEHQVILCLAMIFFIMMMNLRGLKESGTIFAFPTYFFISIFSLTIIVGFYKWAMGSLIPIQGVQMIETSTQSLSLFLILRAFSSGCTAVTGVEAISNGITVFHEPRSKNASRTLVAMAIVLGFFFLGITLLANQIQAVPSHHETIISQVARTVFGKSVFYNLLMAGTTIILIMAANTSYADFPRLCALHAGDGFLPRQLTYKSSRLVFAWGVVFLSLTAGSLVVLFEAHTSALIPLYCIGVFLSFTLSQIGMVIHWQKVGKTMGPNERKGWRRKQIINAIGGLASGIVTLVFATTKFMSGAWVSVILIPIFVFIFFRIHKHYEKVGKFLSKYWDRRDLANKLNIKTIILIDDVNLGTLKMIQFAKSLGHPWIALHVNYDPDRANVVKEKWTRQVPDGVLKLIDSPFRYLAEPIIQFIRSERDQNKDLLVHVITGQLVVDSALGSLLHSKNARGLLDELHKIDRVIVTPVPFHLRQ